MVGGTAPPQPGDYILAINAVSTAGLTHAELVEVLCGVTGELHLLLFTPAGGGLGNLSSCSEDDCNGSFSSAGSVGMLSQVLPGLPAGVVLRGGGDGQAAAPFGLTLTAGGVGLTVATVAVGSGAARARIEPGMVLIAIGAASTAGMAVDNAVRLLAAAGREVGVVVLDGSDEKPPPIEVAVTRGEDGFGMTLSSTETEGGGIETATVGECRPDGAAYAAGLRIGDVLVALNDTRVQGLTHDRLVAEIGAWLTVRLAVQRPSWKGWRTIQLVRGATGGYGMKLSETGAVLDVRECGPAALAGIRKGECVAAVGPHAMPAPAAFAMLSSCAAVDIRMAT